MLHQRNRINAVDRVVEEEGHVVIDCPVVDVALCPLCNSASLNIYQLQRHLVAEHPGAEVEWRCTRCTRVFDKPHAFTCHFNYCREREAQVQPDHQFRCEDCDSAFATQRGLSQHERHRHPGLRNNHRQEEAERPRLRPGLRATVFSQEELVRLQQLNDAFREAAFPNVQLARFFPGRTNRQVGEARRRLQHDASWRVVMERMPPNDPVSGDGSQPATPPPCTPQSPSSSGDHQPTPPAAQPSGSGILDPQPSGLPTSATPTEEEVQDGNVALAEWQEAIIDHLAAIQNNGIPPNLLERLNACYRGNAEGTVASRLDSFLERDLMQFLKGTNENVGEDQGTQGLEGRRGNHHRRRRRHRRGGFHARRPTNRSQRRRFKYARCQEMFKKAPKKLVEVIEANDYAILEGPGDLPSAERVSPVYKSLWETKGIYNVNNLQLEGQQIQATQFLQPIDVAEVKNKIARMDNSTAAGLDGVQKEHLKKKGAPEVLTRLYNLILVFECFPGAWRKNRTVLIPKNGKDLKEVANWRPITVGSVLSRIFTSILDTRMRSVVKINDRQRGFISENGCRGNIALLDEAIHMAKTTSGGVFSILDMKRAFDVIPHDVIRAALIAKGFPRRFADYIIGMYKDCSTVIKTAQGVLVEVILLRGVKQGCPLSPLLFNISIDHILGLVQNMNLGLDLENRNLGLLAFADDLVLIAKDSRAAQIQLHVVEQGLKEIGMSLSAEKCSTFQYITYHDSWYMKDPILFVGTQRIQCIEPGEDVRYLGGRLGPWQGFLKGSELAVIKRFMLGLSRLPLKPRQKVALLTTHIVPKFIYPLYISNANVKILRNIDAEIRMFVKRTLHLVDSTTNCIFYASRRNGGLGIPRLEHIIPLTIIRNGMKLRDSTDEITSNVGNQARIEASLVNAAKSVRLNWPATLEQVEEHKRRLKLQNIREWEKQACQGQGLRYFQDDAVGNMWLTNPSLLKGSRFTDAIRLRTNTYGLRAVFARYTRGLDATCRKCGNHRETLGHVLGSCVTTKPSRIHRHDEIKHLIANRLQGNYRVIVEPSMSIRGELYKPDLIVFNGARAFVVDVTVRYENQRYLHRAATEKVTKYGPILDDVMAFTRCPDARVLPIVVGSRGAMPLATKRTLTDLNIGKQDQLTISMMALRSSIEILNRFLDE